MKGLRTSLPLTTELIEQGMRERLHTGVQVCVSIDGEIVADGGLGEARPGVPMSPDTITLWLSATKPIVAVAVGQLWERGAFDLDDPVWRLIPEFREHDKELITLRHILTHTGGLRFAEARWRSATWDEIIANICAARLERGWVPGQRAGYHVASGWYVLAEIVRRVDGRPFERYVRDEIFEPLGMVDSWVGMPEDRYYSYGDRIGFTYDTSGDEPIPHDLWNSAEGCGSCRPGGNGRGPMRELGRFYEMLLGRGRLEDVAILGPQTVEALTGPHRVGMYDQTFKHIMDWGLGFIVDSNRYGTETVPYGYGRHASPRAFGHAGYQSSTAFCDPEHRLVVAVATNGTPGDEPHQQRMRDLLSAIYVDLGLVDEPSR